MVSTLEPYKHFPSHIKCLLSDLSSGKEVISILSSYIPSLSSDINLYYIFLHFGYSPEHGNFLSPPSAPDMVSYITKEYHGANTDIEEACNKSVIEVKKEFLDTFYSKALQELTDPSDIDLTECQDIKQEPLENYWGGGSPTQKQALSSMTTPSDMNTPRVNKGLKILSRKIREILIQKGKISYKEMAEQVVSDMESHKEIDRDKEGRNVLRRIYDSLNVLEACGVVGKADKKYYWKGFPTQKSEFNENLAQTVDDSKNEVENKRESLRELCKRYYSLRELILRNTEKSKTQEKIEFPFIIVGTEEHHTNKVRIESNKSHNDVSVKFHKQMKLFGDVDVLINLGLYKRPMRSPDIPIDLFESLACKVPGKI